MYLWRAMPSQLFRTGRPEALALGNSCVLSLTHPALPVHTALSHTSRRAGPEALPITIR